MAPGRRCSLFAISVWCLPESYLAVIRAMFHLTFLTAMLHFPSPPPYKYEVSGIDLLAGQPHPIWDSRRLWSLWDMLRILGKPFVDASSLVGQLIALVQNQALSSINFSFRLQITEILDKLIEQVEGVGLNLTKISAVRLRDTINNPNFEPKILTHYMVELQYRLSDELASTYFLSLSNRERELYAPALPLFGSEVVVKFPSTAYEIDEAAKCLALSRGTACVFHLMRLMEISVRAVARCLNIADPVQPADRSWGAILKKVRDGIEAKWPTAASRLAGDGEIFDSLYASLDAVKNPWRNSTMLR
jgi:hypothetical protein